MTEKNSQDGRAAQPGDARVRTTDLPDLDPRGLLFEAYRIEGITGPDCRSVFLDWALGQAAGTDLAKAVVRVHGFYQPRHPDHPMTQVLAEGLVTGGDGRKRGRARRARRG